MGDAACREYLATLRMRPISQPRHLRTKGDVNGALTGGTTEISGVGEVVMAQKSSESVAFLSKSTGELVLDQAPSFSGSISGLGTTHDLTDILDQRNGDYCIA